MKCDKCGAPTKYMDKHPIGLPPRYDTSEIDQLQAELKELMEYKLIFDDDTALKHVVILRDEIKVLKAENKQLKQYREYVKATISRGSMN